MKRILVVLSIILTAPAVLFAHEQNREQGEPIALTVSQTEKEEWENLQKRFSKFSLYMPGLLWTLTHAYQSKSENGPEPGVSDGDRSCPHQRGSGVHEEV